MAQGLVQVNSSYIPSSSLTDTSVAKVFVGGIDPSTVASLRAGDIWFATASGYGNGGYGLMPYGS